MTRISTVPKVIEIDALEVSYGRTRAVDRVTFGVREGEVYALLGRNGSGKSSLVRCLSGLYRPDGGEARLFGRDGFRHRLELAPRLGVVPEEPDAPTAMTARGLERFCARLYPSWDTAGYAARLERFGVPAGRAFGKLSRGQKSQVMLALALASGPDVLVLDDPTLGLDAVARRTVFEEVIGELAERGITVLVTSHELAAVEGIANRLGFLDRGRLLVDEDLEPLKARFRRISWTPSDRGLEPTVVLERFAGLAEPLAPVVVTPRPWGIEAVVERFREANLGTLRQDPATGRVEAEALGLEEIFIALVGERTATVAGDGSRGGTR
jgi:ABC-2 type transport system ATP-binding protein